ncbi:Uncharacterized protein Adt_42794 [Abeliophyllum distichum]|uniref:Uncharacterized protein n=1 Tax=Abeliophyllum distichum TaxID=126358 RepID=A0ABD1PU91_9LAMI
MGQIMAQFIPNIGPNLIKPQAMPYVHQPIGVHFDPNAILIHQVVDIMQDQLAFRIRPVIRPTCKKSYPDWIDQAYPWPRGYKVPEFFFVHWLRRSINFGTYRAFYAAMWRDY